MKIVFFLLFFLASSAYAGVEKISEEEFRELAQELAPKVNLFRQAWENDPKAEFYGGTTRDYLYWLKGQFIEAKTHEQAEAVVAKLKSLPLIDVREFIIGDSDVDIISSGYKTVNAADYGVRKIDLQSPDILDPKTQLGQNEILQGYIPAEKIRLGRDGFHPTGLGEGLKEIYDGKLSVHFASAENFAKSKYAQEGVNHPILLALRYLRIQAINYYRSHGKAFPDAVLLQAGMDEASAKAVREVIERATNTKELAPFLQRNKFKSWINGGIQKAFRSYTNPTAALELMKKFGVTQLPLSYPDEIEAMNQYVFSQFRDSHAIEKNLAAFGVQKDKFFASPEKVFSDGYLYHGTRTEPAFRAILFQGALNSESGSAGPGLYGVAAENKEFSEKWAEDRKRLLRFPVEENAKIVNIKEGEGKKIWEKFHNTLTSNRTHPTLDDFAQAFGIDIIKYPYSTDAFVVKNSDALGQAEGVYRKIMPFGELLEKVKGEKDAHKVLSLLDVNGLAQNEVDMMWDAADVSPESIRAIVNDTTQDFGPIAKYVTNAKKYRDSKELVDGLVARLILTPKKISAEHNAIVDAVIQKSLAKYPDLVVRLNESAGKDYGDAILKNIFFDLDEVTQAHLLRTLAGNFPQTALDHVLRRQYRPGYEKVMEDLITAGFGKAFTADIFFHPGWENHPELIEQLIALKDAKLDKELAQALKAPNWRGHSAELLYKLSKNDNIYWELFAEILDQPEWGDKPEFFERIIRSFLQAKPNLLRRAERLNDYYSLASMLDATLTREKHWINNDKLRGLTNGAPVNLENLERAFAEGKTLLPPEELSDSMQARPKSLLQRCGEFFGMIR